MPRLLNSFHFDQDEMNKAMEFDEPVIGIAFIGSSGSKLVLVDHKGENVLKSTGGIALSFYAPRDSKVYINTEKEGTSNTLIGYVPAHKMDKERFEVFNTYLPDFLDKSSEVQFGPYCYLTPVMLSVLEKIGTNNYENSLKDLLFRSQTTELLAHYFAFLSSPQNSAFSPEEMNLLYKAKDFIIDSSQTPSIEEVSRQVGLNTSFLKKNFKEIFGTTIYQYGLNQRLIKAYNMLSENHISTKEAAWMAGYDSLSSFSNAFYKRFGFRPSRLKQREYPQAS